METQRRRAGAGRHRKPESAAMRAVRWTLVALAAVVSVVLIARIAMTVIQSDEETQAQPTRVPQAQQAPEPDDKPEAAAEDIPPSRPLEMMIPSVDLHASFEDVNCLNKDGKIDPTTLHLACAYTADDRPYSLPGSTAKDIAVVAGHAAAGVPAVFDKLYDPDHERHTITVGDALYIKTEASGEKWLKYEATDLHEPEKTALADDPAIWGTGPIPGRLLTITCIRPANPFAPSVRNAVIGWQFTSVVGPEEAAQGPPKK